jgi:hypothetical protein
MKSAYAINTLRKKTGYTKNSFYQQAVRLYKEVSSIRFLFYFDLCCGGGWVWYKVVINFEAITSVGFYLDYALRVMFSWIIIEGVSYSLLSCQTWISYVSVNCGIGKLLRYKLSLNK